jgi:hypothetical protein
VLKVTACFTVVGLVDDEVDDVTLERAMVDIEI